MFDFKLPDIGEGLAEAEIIDWTIEKGQTVKEGDIVAEISTDKVTVELTSPRDGKIAEICAEIGNIIEVGTVILRIDEQSTSEGNAKKTAPNQDNIEKLQSTNKPVTKTPKVRTSPAVRRFASENNVDLADVVGSGPDGMIVKKDIVNVLQKNNNNTDRKTSEKRIKLTGAGLSAAQNISKAANIMATTSISFDVDADNLATATNNKSPLSIIALCLREALIKHPKFNATIDEENNELVLGNDINLGLAVTANNQLLVPVIGKLNEKNAADAKAAIDDITKRARDDKLDPKEMRGSTFTLSSTGGIEGITTTSTTPIINHPNVAILWVSRFTDRPWVKDGQLTVAKVMSCTLGFDHRYLHGSDGFAFINDFEQLLQSPNSVLN